MTNSMTQAQYEFRLEVVSRILEISEKFFHPKPGDTFFDKKDCPLCSIYYYQGNEQECKGCPFANEDGKQGCFDLRYYKEATYWFRGHCKEVILPTGKAFRTFPDGIEPPNIFLMFGQLLDGISDILQMIHPSRFTSNDWRFFLELDYARVLKKGK